MNFAMLAFAIVCEVIATLLLKASDGWIKWCLALAAVGFYMVAGALLSIVLKHLSVGITYAIWAGTGIALICIASSLIWHQRLDAAALSGILLIVSGVSLIAFKSGVVLQ